MTETTDDLGQPWRGLVTRLSQAPDIQTLPTLVDVSVAVPPNPPSALQEKFVGYSYEDAYLEASRYIKQAAGWSDALGRPIAESKAVLDFGVGWGRISRILLSMVPPIRIYGLDVDAEMVALVQQTLPGINAATVGPMPPSPLRAGLVEHAMAYSVFSHLGEQAHEAWAHEFGRLVAPGGLAFVTVLDEVFLRQVQQCKEEVLAGSPSAFAVSMADLLPDMTAARRSYEQGRFIYAAPAVEDGPRTTDFYGWAVAPRPWVERVWGQAGFVVKDWIDSHQIVPQAIVCLQRVETPKPRRRLFR